MAPLKNEWKFSKFYQSNQLVSKPIFTFSWFVNILNSILTSTFKYLHRYLIISIHSFHNGASNSKQYYLGKMVDIFQLIFFLPTILRGNASCMDRFHIYIHNNNKTYTEPFQA